jgi:hypothetical protein
MFDFIVIGIVLWIVVAVIGVGAVLNDGDHGDEAVAITIFWPVTLPIIIFFGFWYGLWNCLKMCVGWFRN